MRRSDWLWIGLAGLLMLAGSGIVPLAPPERVETDSFSVSAGGKKAFFTLAQTLLHQVHRSSEHLTPPDDADTLVILGPARYPDRAGWQRLYRWVEQGHSLVFAARWNDPGVDMGAFGVKVETDGRQDGDLETSLAGGDIEWRSNGHVLTTFGDAQVAVARDGSAQVIQQGVGEGLLVVASSDFIFTNLALTRGARGDSGFLAFRILELAAPQGPVYFDEWLGGQAATKVVGLLFEDPLRPLTLQILICAVVLAWRAGRRFGPPVTPRKATRRSLSEHAVALGNLHYKAGRGGGVVASYLEFFRHELSLHYRKAEETRAIAERAGLDSDGVDHLLSQARQAALNPTLEPAKAAWLVRSLAALKKKAERLKGDVHGA